MSGEYIKDCLGDTIKTSRILKGMTQPQLAGILGISTRYLKLIENDGRKPSYKLLARIVVELEIPSDRIFCIINLENKI